MAHSGSYGASKRAQEHMSEVFRVELSPFNVKVLSVVTGAVSTNGQTYFEDWALPANSRYKLIESTLAKTVRGIDGVPRTPLMTYANNVVDNILGGATGRVWLGERAEMMRDASVQGEVAAGMVC